MGGETLSLKQAAKMAGVSEVTMRAWAQEIPSVKRSKSGAYEIPEEDFRGYLAGKDPRKTRSGGKAKPGVKVGTFPPDEGRLAEEVKWLRDELRDAREELKKAHAEIRQLEAELRAHLSGGIGGALSRWIKGR